MKICIICGFISGDKVSSCTNCTNEDLRIVTNMKISLGKFEGSFKLSDEEEKILERLRGYDVIDDNVEVEGQDRRE